MRRPDMEDSPMKSCPDCKTELRPINIVSQIWPVTGRGSKIGLSFTQGDAPEFRFWGGKMKNQAGLVHAFLCEDCSRVLLYADA